MARYELRNTALFVGLHYAATVTDEALREQVLRAMVQMERS